MMAVRNAGIRALILLVLPFAGAVVFSYTVLEPPGQAPLINSWSRFVPSEGGVQAEQFTSLAQLTRMSDAVVRGSIVGVQPGRAYEGAPGDVLRSVVYLVEGEVVAGGRMDRSRDTALRLEVFVGDERAPEGVPAIQPLDAPLPEGEALFFLRNKATSIELFRQTADPDVERDYYRLVNTESLVVNNLGAAQPIGGDHSAESRALATHPDFERLVAAVRQASSG